MGFYYLRFNLIKCVIYSRTDADAKSLSDQLVLTVLLQDSLVDRAFQLKVLGSIPGVDTFSFHWKIFNCYASVWVKIIHCNIPLIIMIHLGKGNYSKSPKIRILFVPYFSDNRTTVLQNFIIMNETIILQIDFMEMRE